MGTNPHTGRFLEQLNQYVGWTMKIVTRSGWRVQGVLYNVDLLYHNLIIESGTVYTIKPNGERTTTSFNCVLIRGDSVLFYRVLRGPAAPR